MTEREFFVRYRAVDAILVAASWRLYLRCGSRWDLRQLIMDDLDELAERAEVDLFRARHAGSESQRVLVPPPPPAAAPPELRPVS